MGARARRRSRRSGRPLPAPAAATSSPGVRTRWRARAPGGRDDSGLMTLEWLLIVAAVAGLAAGSVLAVQRVLDETIEVPRRPEVRLIDADVAAAHLVGAARDALAAGTYDDAVFAAGCLVDIPARFADVVQFARWTSWDQATLTLPDCTVTPRQF